MKFQTWFMNINFYLSTFFIRVTFDCLFVILSVFFRSLFVAKFTSVHWKFIGIFNRSIVVVKLLNGFFYGEYAIRCNYLDDCRVVYQWKGSSGINQQRAHRRRSITKVCSRAKLKKSLLMRYFELIKLNKPSVLYIFLSKLLYE